MKDTFIIIPVYNEATVLEETIQRVLHYGYTIVVVDDGSRENVSSIAAANGVYYLRHRFNLGQGAALQTGISFALKKGAAFLATFDADGQHDASDIPQMMEALKNSRVDIVFGSRFLTRVPSEITFLRKLLLQAARFLNYVFSGILLSDAHNGLRVFNRKAAKSFNIHENRMAHATEILIQVKRHKLRYKEFPVHISYTRYSKQKGQKIFHSFKVLQDIILHKLFK